MRGARILLVVASWMVLGNAQESTEPQQISFTTIEQSHDIGPRARAIATKGGFNGLTHRPCSSSGISGKCMFMWECLKGKGSPMGICQQGFLFGTCCAPSNVQPTTRPTTIPAFITTKHTTIHPTHGTTTGRTTTTETTTITTPKTTPTITTPKQKPTTSTTTSRPTTSTITPKPTTTVKPTTTPKPTTTAKPTTTPKPTTATSTTTTTEAPKAVNILSKKECGLPYLDPILRDGRIVNGSDATFGEFPWLVSLMKANSGPFKHNCGAAVLDNTWVITAAHCVSRFLKSQLRLRIGEHNLATEQEPHPYVERGVKKIIVHPDFDYSTFTFNMDIALLQMDQPLNFQKIPHVAPICLPGSHHQLVGQNGTIAGWGRLEDGGPTPKILQKTILPIVSNERCMSMFRDANLNENIPEWFFCAGYAEGQIDSCQGDSGGPMVVQDATGRYFLGGIVSWGIGCAKPNHPGVYTRVSHFMPWILKHVT